MKLVRKHLCGILIKFEEEEMEEAEVFLKTMAEGFIQSDDDKARDLGKNILEFLKNISEEQIGSA